MTHGVLQTFALLDLSGQLILAAIAGVWVLALLGHVLVRSQYARLAADLRRNADSQLFESSMLGAIVQQLQELVRHSRVPVDPSTLNTQAIIEQQAHHYLRRALLAERFVRAAGSLVIVLGLVGTFYGLTLSIAELAGLVSGEAREAADLTQSLTSGLREALAGMSVAFTTSLVGIAAAVVLTLVGVASSLADRRAGLLLEVETFLDRLLAQAPGVAQGRAPRQSEQHSLASGGSPEGSLQSVRQFDAAVGRLQESMNQFEIALQHFSATTRDFREFNLHLKDNVQRMSLNFGDFSEALRSQVEQLRHGRG